MTATTTTEITTAQELDALELHTLVADNQGTTWKKIYRSGWHFLCAGGLSHNGQSSAWLAQHAPLALAITEIEQPGSRFHIETDQGEYWGIDRRASLVFAREHESAEVWEINSKRIYCAEA